MDRSFYPSKGIKLTFGADYDFMKSGSAAFDPILTGYLNFNSVIPFGEHFAILPEIHLRALLENDFNLTEYDGYLYDSNPKYSISHKNYVGGVIPDRYMEGQIPFIGFGDVYMAGPLVGVAQVGLRGQIGNFFLTATGGYFRQYFDFDDFLNINSVNDVLNIMAPSVLGAGVELAYVTPLGPVKVLGTWSPRNNNFSQDAGLYISLGFDF
jgi:hypothetical protein